MQNYNQCIQVYTDGSIPSEGEVECAFTISAFNITKWHKLNKRVSIFLAELTAILKASSYIAYLPMNKHNVVILSDSKSALEAIENETKNRNNMQNEIRYLCHNLAYSAARNATTISNILLDNWLSLSWIKNEVKQRAWKQKFKRTEFYGKQRNWLVFPRNLENCLPQ